MIAEYAKSKNMSDAIEYVDHLTIRQKSIFPRALDKIMHGTNERGKRLEIEVDVYLESF